MKRVTAFILVGSEEIELSPLVEDRVWESLPFGGGFRLIDFTLLNCVRSEVSRVIVPLPTTQPTLISHLRNLPREMAGRTEVRVVASNQRVGPFSTCEALRDTLRFVDWTVDDSLIASGRDIYRMNFERMLTFHRESGADVTVAASRMPRGEVEEGTLVRSDRDGRVVGWDVLSSGKIGDGEESAALVDTSMDVFLVKREVLSSLLLPPEGPLPEDFVSEALPRALELLHVSIYRPADHDSESLPCWRNVGSLRSYWAAQMEYLEKWHSLLSEDGTAVLPRGLRYVAEGFEGRVVNAFVPTSLERVEGAIRNSILAADVQLKGRVQIVDSIIHGGVVIEDGCVVHKAILARGARLTGEARVDPKRTRPGSQIRTWGGLTVVPRDVLVRGPAKIPRPGASLQRTPLRVSLAGG